MASATGLRKRIGRALAAVVLSGLVAGCATNPAGEVYDPLEPVNRQVFAFNSAVDTVLIRPAAVVYRDFTPSPIKRIVGNFISHLTLPLTIIHDLAQGKPERAEIAAKRFFINTTAGMGGLFDIATPTGIKYHREDMGQTLAVHGSGEGPYLVLPILGPSNLRDGIGDLIDRVIDPVNVVATLPEEGGTAFRVGRAVTAGIVNRERLIEPLDSLKRQSLDYYVAVRSAYSQRRQAEIEDGKVEPMPYDQDAFSQAEKAAAPQ